MHTPVNHLHKSFLRLTFRQRSLKIKKLEIKELKNFMKKYNLKASLQSILRLIKINGTGNLTYNIVYSKTTRIKLKSSAAKNNDIKSKIKMSENQKKLVLNKLKFNNVVLHTPTHVQRNGIMMEADLNFAYSESLIELGIPVRNIDTNTSLTKDRLPKGTLIIIDGNHFAKFSKEKLNEINLIRKQGCYVAFDHTDLLESKDAKKIINQLYEFADLGIIHNPLIDLPEILEKKTLLWPTYPYSKIFESEKFTRKDNSLLFSGTSFRGLNGRKYYLNYLRKHKFPVNNQMLHSKPTGKINFLYLDYLRSLELCTMSFTTGYRSNKESLLAFRVVELMLRETVVFYEEGSFINHFFKPYEHYIPVFNAPDLLFKAKHLLNNSEFLNKITTEAKEFVQNKYSHYIFWQSLNEKL
jgi:hypothetical protein